MAVVDLAPFFANVGGDPVRDAFASRRALLPWRNRRALPAEEMSATWTRLLGDHRPSGSRLAYVHVPFCANHCLFCGFYRNAYTPEAASAYADLVIAEIEGEARSPAVGSQPIEAVYLGGGTPSALSASELSRLLHTVRRCLPLSPGCEITVEGRIIHFDPEKIDACLDAGANRISIGVQSFDTDVRRRQGRRSTREEAIAFIEALRDRDRATVVIDLLYGLPGQTDEIWREDLRIAAGIGPDGVDIYGLNLIPGTPLQRAVSAGKFPTAPSLGDLGRMYRAGAEYLAGKGWEQISNSHWRSTPRERNVYNLRIKEGLDCLAYGSGAGGLLGSYSYAIASDLQAYTQAVREGRKPVDGMRVSDARQPLRNLVTAGIETGRLDLAQVAAAAATPGVRQVLEPLLEQWRSAGLVELSGDILSLTTAGRFWYSNLVFAFDAVLCENPSRSGDTPLPPSLTNHPKKRQLS